MKLKYHRVTMVSGLGKEISCLLFCWILFILVTITGCQTGSSENESPITEEEKESVEVRPEVLFAVADDCPIFQYIESQGIVEANRSIQLKPKISGYIERSVIREDRRVKKGDTLLVFDRREYQIAVNEALNTYEEARQKYKLETKMRALEGSTATDETKTGETDRMIRITTGLAQAEVDLKRARLDLAYSVLTAPFTGVLSAEERLESGTYLAAGNTIARLVDARTVRIRFDILESEYNKVSEGMSVQLTAPDGEQVTGVVEAVDPVINTETKTGTVVVRADNRGNVLVPGMTVEGRIRIRKQDGKTRVPRSAILSRDGGRTLLFKLNSENNEVQWVYVEPVAQNNEWAIINHQEVSPGDTIAVDHHFALSHLQIVEPQMRIE